jgi:hypothetical protein
MIDKLNLKKSVFFKTLQRLICVCVFCVGTISSLQAQMRIISENQQVVLTSGAQAQTITRRFLATQANEKVILRGVNQFFWTYSNISEEQIQAQFAEIAKTGANCVRIGWLDEAQKPISWLKTAIIACINNKMIPVVMVHDATEAAWTAKFQKSINFWTLEKPGEPGEENDFLDLYKGNAEIRKWLVLNISNETGLWRGDVPVKSPPPDPNNPDPDPNPPFPDNRFLSGQFDRTTGALVAPGYAGAISQIRDAGYKCTLMIDAPDFGQNEDALIKFWREVSDSDPLDLGGITNPLAAAVRQKNIMFSIHPYWSAPSGKSWKTLENNTPALATQIARLNAFFTNRAAYEMPWVIGEGLQSAGFDCKNNWDYVSALEVLKNKQIGLMPWSWGGFYQKCIENYNITAPSPTEVFPTIGSGVTYTPVYGRWSNTWARKIMVDDPNSIQKLARRPLSMLSTTGISGSGSVILSASITNIDNNSFYSITSGTSTNITLNAIVGVPDGLTVSNVQFLRGTTVIGSDNTAPYSISWAATQGTYTDIASGIMVRVTASNNTTATSTPLTVFVYPAITATSFNGDYTIRARTPMGKAIEVSVNGNNTVLTQRTYQGFNNQVWNITPFRTAANNNPIAGVGANVFRIRNKSSDKCANIAAGNTTIGDTLRIFTCDDNLQQQWRINRVGTNGYIFTNVGTNRVMQVLDNTTDDNKKINQNIYTGNLQQIWTINTFTADTQLPTAPTVSALLTNVGSTTTKLTWTNATDNVAVVRYRVFQGNIELTPANGVTTTSFDLTGLTSNTLYAVGAFTVLAYDAANNASPVAQSPQFITRGGVFPDNAAVPLIGANTVKIEAENFDIGQQNTSFFDKTSGLSAGTYRTGDDRNVELEVLGTIRNITSIENNEYLSYTVNVAQTGFYTLEARVAGVNATGRFEVQFSQGAVTTGDITFPSTSANTTTVWTTIRQIIKLEAGEQIMTVRFKKSGFKLDFINIKSNRVEAEGSGVVRQGIDLITSGEKLIAGFSGTGHTDAASLDSFGNTAASIPTDNLVATINVDVAGTYKVDIRYYVIGSGDKDQVIFINGNEFGVGKFLNPDGTSGTWKTLTLNRVALNAGNNTVKIQHSFGFVGFDYFEISGDGKIAGVATPYNGVTSAIPSLIQAENYDEGGPGTAALPVAFIDKTIDNTAGQYRADGVDIGTTNDSDSKGNGFNVTATESGEELRYSVNVSTPGNYILKMRVRSTVTNNSIGVVFSGGANTTDKASATTVVSNTNPAWSTVDIPINGLVAGKQTMKVLFPVGGVEFNYVDVQSVNKRAEAEDGVFTNMTKPRDVITTKEGYSGTGYISEGGFDEGFAKTTVTFTGVAAGTYAIRVRYTNNRSGIVRQDLLINKPLTFTGSGDDYVAFPSTGGEWAIQKIGEYQLNGVGEINTIALRKSDGGMTIDYFEISPCPNCRTSAEETVNDESSSVLEVYPNPTTKDKEMVVKVTANESTQADISLIDVMGKPLFSLNKDLEKGVNEIRIDNQNRATGVYFIQVNIDAKRIVKKIIIE